MKIEQISKVYIPPPKISFKDLLNFELSPNQKISTSPKFTVIYPYNDENYKIDITPIGWVKRLEYVPESDKFLIDCYRPYYKPKNDVKLLLLSEIQEEYKVNKFLEILINGNNNNLKKGIEKKIRNGDTQYNNYFPGISKLFDVNVNFEKILVDKETNISDYESSINNADIGLIILSSNNHKVQALQHYLFDIRYTLFSKYGFPNKFIVNFEKQYKFPNAIFSTGKDLLARIGFIPYVLSNEISDLLKDFIIVGFDSTNLSFYHKELKLGIPIIFFSPDGNPKKMDIDFVIHPSERTSLEAAIDRVRMIIENNKELQNKIIVIIKHGFLSELEVANVKDKITDLNVCCIGGITQSEHAPERLFKINTTEKQSLATNPNWGVGFKISNTSSNVNGINREEYILNLTWNPLTDIGCIRAVRFQFYDLLGINNDFKYLSDTLVIWASWSTVMSWAAPYRFPTLPWVVELPDRYGKLVTRLITYLSRKKNIKNHTQLVSDVKGAFDKLANKSGIEYAGAYHT